MSFHIFWMYKWKKICSLYLDICGRHSHWRCMFGGFFFTSCVSEEYVITQIYVRTNAIFCGHVLVWVNCEVRNVPSALSVSTMVVPYQLCSMAPTRYSQIWFYLFMTCQSISKAMNYKPHRQLLQIWYSISRSVWALGQSYTNLCTS